MITNLTFYSRKDLLQQFKKYNDGLEEFFISINQAKLDDFV